MTRLRVIDYVGNRGGGLLFGVELLKALMAARPGVQAELVGYGESLARYRAVLEGAGIYVPIIALRPGNMPSTRTLGIPGTARLKTLLGRGTDGRFDVPESALKNCDVAWFPWLHRHRLPDVCARHVVGSFHDAIIFMWPGLLNERSLVEERYTLLQWLGSRARIVVSSRTTLAALARLFHVDDERFAMIPLSGGHMCIPPEPATGQVQLGPFVLCPANTSPHKNHEVLLQGVATSGLGIPLVLTGPGTSLRSQDPRGGQLRRLALSCGLQIGTSLFPLGYVSTETCRSLLSRAWAVVMPSLMEGGGSFPVFEAMQCGVPVVCSDISVLREQIGRTGGEVVWFNPCDATDLAKKLRHLHENYAQYKEAAVAHVALLRRTWRDVAGEYWTVLDAAGDSLQ